MVRIIVPFVAGGLRAETKACCGDRVAYVELGDDHAYARLLLDLWAEGEGFAVVEQDMLIHDKVFPTWDRCRHRWCGFPYPMSFGENIQAHVAMGCTKFSTSLLTREPDALEIACAIDDDGLGPMDWRRMDVRIARVLQDRGYRPIQHAPRVIHLHYEDALAAGSAGFSWPR